MMRSMLLIEPDGHIAERVRRIAQTLDSEVVAFADVASADDAAHARRYDLAVLSSAPRAGCDAGFTQRLRHADPDLVCCALIESSEPPRAADELGVDDCLDPASPDESLARSLQRLLERGRLRHRRTALRDAVHGDAGASGLVCRSTKMKRVISLVDGAARSRGPVLIVGETGTGKRALATAIHRFSDRRYQQLHVITCESDRSADWESTLFGREAAAFAHGGGREGLLGRATGSTIIVRNLERMPAHCQERLLQVLETGRFCKVSGAEVFECEVRIIGLASPALDAELKARHFRHDLFYRFAQMRIDLPPLRERREAIPLIARHFLEQFRGMSTPPVTSIDPAAMRILLAHDWPENLRELERCLRLAVARTSGSVVRAEALPASLRNMKRLTPPPDNSLIDTSRPLAEVTNELVEQVERAYLLAVLQLYRGRVAAAARHSGMSRRGVTDKLRRLGIAKDSYNTPFLFDELKPTQA